MTTSLAPKRILITGQHGPGGRRPRRPSAAENEQGAGRAGEREPTGRRRGIHIELAVDTQVKHAARKPMAAASREQQRLVQRRCGRSSTCRQRRR